MAQLRGPEPGRAADSSKYLGVGLTWVLAVALFTYLGLRADGWLGTDPWLTLVGVFVGLFAGFYYMYRHLVIEPRRARQKSRDE